MARFITHIVMLGLLLVAAAAVGAASPKALAKDADRLYKDGKYREAAETLSQAYELDANPLYLYNIARAWDQAGEIEQALERYRQYVAKPSDETQPDLVSKANRSMDRLRLLLAKNEADKKIQEADKKRLEDEKRRAEARADTEAQAAREQRETYEQRERAQRDAQSSTRSTKKLISYVSAGVAVASFVTSIIFAVLANGSRNQFRQATTLEGKQQFEAATRGQALVTDLTLLVGLAAGATAVVLYPKGGDTQQSVNLALSPWSGGGVVSLWGTF